MATDDDNSAAATFDAVNALSRVFADVLVQLTKTDALTKSQVVDIILANELFIADLLQAERKEAAKLYQTIHDNIFSSVQQRLSLHSLAAKQRQRRQKPASP